MYFSLLPKPHFKCVSRLLTQQQLQVSGGISLGAKHKCTGLVASTNGQRNNIQAEKRTKAASYPLLWTAVQRNYCVAKHEATSDAVEASSTVDTSGESAAHEEEDVDAEMSNYSLKTLLYANDSDELLQILNSCKDHTELLTALEQHSDRLQRQHRVQSIILLWTHYLYAAHKNTRDLITQVALPQNALTQLLPYVATLNALEASCCYLYLRKMGVTNANDVLQALLLRALHLVELSATIGSASATLEFPLPLRALSRLVVGIKSARDFNTSIVCAHFMPHIEAHTRNCASAEEVRLLAVCMLNLQPLVSHELLAAFKARVTALLVNGSTAFSRSDTPRTLLKLLNMLNLPAWSPQNTALIREIMLALQPHVAQLSELELRTLCRVFQHQLEPAALLAPLRLASEAYLRRQSSAEALVCFMPFAAPRRREPLIALFKSLLLAVTTADDDDDVASWQQQQNASGTFFALLRGLKVADARLCDAYWQWVLRKLDSYSEEQTHLRFLRHCHRYMNFNNNLGGTYRHLELERRLSAMAMHAIETDMAGRVPMKFARLAGFVFAYGHTPHSWKKFPNVLLSKIISMAPQFSIGDCFLISRGLQLALELRFRYFTPSLLGMQLATIDSILVACAERHLSSDEAPSVNDLNTIVRTLGFRKSLKNTGVYQEALNRYKQLDSSALNSRIIREMTYNFSAANFCEPKSLEAIFNYIEDNHEHVLGDTVEKVLSCAYSLGYTPQSHQVLEYAGFILMRDFDNMSGFALVQACLALCFYKTIPEELINKVFCVKFIQRIEDEIQMCYSKATYPERVLNMVMQLNRTVCLDFPEANVPWFQQNYIEAQQSRRSFVQSSFSGEVKNLMQELLKDDSHFRCNHTTPYGYQIDFVIHFDRDKNPIPAPIETTMLDRITKVAILLLKLDSFCENDLTALRGPELLKIKHLEMMGYKVLHINEHDWNSKYLNAPSAKANYLKCLLQITN